MITRKKVVLPTPILMIPAPAPAAVQVQVQMIPLKKPTRNLTLLLTKKMPLILLKKRSLKRKRKLLVVTFRRLSPSRDLQQPVLKFH